MANSRPERFIDRVIAEGVSVHNIKRLSKHVAVMTVRHRDLPTIRSVSEQEGCEIELLRRGGLQLAAGFIRSRLALVIALALACAALLLLSRRLFAVRIEGCDANLAAELFETAERLGIKRGMLLSDIDTSLLSARLRSVDPGISFVSAAVDGVVLKLSVSMGTADRSEAGAPPCSIYADKDCVILRIAALDGKLCVKAGDAVRAGQLLVDGDITPEGAESPTLVHAAAEIIAEAAYRFALTVEPTAKAPARSGKTAAYTELSLFGLNIDSETGFERFDRQPETHAALSAFPLPICVTGGTAWEIALTETRRSRDEMLAEALERADRMLTSAIPKQAKLISKTTEPVWNEDGSMTFSVTVHTIEYIGYSRYL